VQEFRPAAVIAADTELAHGIEARDPVSVRLLVERYGAAVTASATPKLERSAALDVAYDVFVEAVEHPLEPGDEFGPWLAELLQRRVGTIDEQRWELVMAVAAIEPSARPALREQHVDGASDLDDELTRHELRLQRRLSHLGEPHEVSAALSDPEVWIDVDVDLVERVVDDVAVPAVADAESDSGGDSARAVKGSLVSRGLRPALFGLAGAAVVLFVAIVGLSAASGNPQPPDFTVELVPTGVLVDVEGGEITVTERDAGIEIELDAPTLPRRAGGLYYEGRVVLADGNEVSAGTFAEGDGVTLWAGVDLDDAVTFRIIVGDIATSAVGDVVLKADIPQT
jgi:hypothetical protein